MSKTPFFLLVLLSLSFQMKLSIAILSEKQPFQNFQNLFVLILRFLKVLEISSSKKAFF